MEIIDYFSPNFDKNKRTSNLIQIIVIHYTGMQSERESLDRLTNPKSKVSCHLLINKVGRVYRLVDNSKTAWHAGKSCWGKLKNINKNSIGIELVNKGHRLGYTNFNKKQLLSLIKICKNLIKKYKIKKQNIVGHSDVAPLRKIDPGEKFPWEKLASKNIGIWHNKTKSLLKKYRRNENFKKSEEIFFSKNLIKIGYRFPKNNKFFFKKVLMAFQRHYRKELINGLLDKECLIIAQNLAKRL